LVTVIAAGIAIGVGVVMFSATSDAYWFAIGAALGALSLAIRD
jgi:hypothetical protein